jgi:diadenosine tetraphosphate (Ap4A) HIT family hydrolase
MSPLIHRPSNAQHCDFCNEFSGSSRNSFARLYQNKPKERIVLSTANFRVVPSLGQIVEGHLLIVPAVHFTAIADVPRQMREELVGVCARVRRTLCKVYALPLLFEHGVRGKNSGGCGVDHAHLHAVPFNCYAEPVEELIRNHSLRPISGIAEIHKEVAPNTSYLYYEQPNGRAWACETNFIPSQYLRRVVAESLGTNSWNWKECGREQSLIRSIERLSESFSARLVEDVVGSGFFEVSAQANLV